jgi:hypothetical protein
MTGLAAFATSLAVAPRCSEVLRGDRGYERCHRADHGGQGEHHVRGRAWIGCQAAGTVRLRFGVPCDPECVFPELVEVWGTTPGRASADGSKRGKWRRTAAAGREAQADR